MIKRIIAKTCNVLFVAILVVIILGTGTILGGQALGYKPLAILSGSMEPNYNVNGLIVVNTNVKAEEMKVGDVISFQWQDETVVTHRIIRIDEAAQLFTTKGDANNTEDTPIEFGALIGKATLHIPQLGGLVLSMRSRKGIAAGLLLLALLVILFVTPILLPEPERKKKKRKGRMRGNDLLMEELMERWKKTENDYMNKVPD